MVCFRQSCKNLTPSAGKPKTHPLETKDGASSAYLYFWANFQAESSPRARKSKNRSGMATAQDYLCEQIGDRHLLAVHNGKCIFS